MPLFRRDPEAGANGDQQPSSRGVSRRALLGGVAASVVLSPLLVACGPVQAEKPPAASPSEGNPPSTPGETEAPKKVDVMTASYEEIKPLTNDELFGELPEDLQPDNLAKLSLDEIRERLSTRIDPNQGGDKELAQAAIAEIIEKHNAYMRLASADVYEDDINKLEELGLAAWQGEHNLPATATPTYTVSTQWRQTAFKYRAERGAKKIAASPIGGDLPEFPTASGVAYDKDSVNLVKREADGTLVVTVKSRFTIKDDAQRVVDREPAPKIDISETDTYRVKVDKTTGKLTWTTVGK